jgi:ribosomal protein L16 Arg81 hydroxylase
MDLADLLSPLSDDDFRRTYYGQRPLHIPVGDGDRKRPIGWDRLNELLAIRSHWTEANIKLMMNARPVFPNLYMDELDRPEGRVRRANRAKVQVFLSMGASLVANSVEDVSPEIRHISSLLSEAFGGRAGANIYCSFKDVQAFASHCDLHEVFALQCEGEKVWNIYENRALAPTETLQGEDAQKIIDSAKGRVALQVRLRPGDLLYIPRGFYHDALASSAASLHVTFSVIPLTGRAVFSLLEELAVEDPEFRQYLEDDRLDSGSRLAKQLEGLAARIGDLMKSERFRIRIAEDQRKLSEPNDQLQLPNLLRLEFYARSDRPAEVLASLSGDVLRSGGGELKLGSLGGAAAWLLGRGAFSVQELWATFPHLAQAELRGLIREMERRSLIFPYTPKM